MFLHKDIHMCLVDFCYTTHMPEEIWPSLKEEIQALEVKLAEKKHALEEGGAAEQPEKDVFREVLREHIEGAREEAAPSVPASSPVTPAPATSLSHNLAAKAEADRIREEEHHKQIEALVQIAVTKGIVSAVGVARHLGNPHLLDDFHDALVDEYYEKLTNARIIAPYV